MNLKEVIAKRRSTRKFKEDLIPDDILNEILEAGRLAPSGGNAQNCFFGVVKEKEIIGKLAEAAGEQFWIATAPTVIAFCVNVDSDLKGLPEDNFGLIVNKARYGDELIKYLNAYGNRKEMCTFFNNCNPLIPGAQMFLTAINHGLGACWVGYLDIKKASSILKLPDDMSCLFLMPIGYSDEEPKDISRKTMDKIVFYNTWKR